jgi:hypothetical protein
MAAYEWDRTTSPGTVTFALSGNASLIVHFVTISDSDQSVAIEAATVTNSSAGTTLTNPTISPSWQSATPACTLYLWAAGFPDESNFVSAGPTSYTSFVQLAIASASVGIDQTQAYAEFATRASGSHTPAAQTLSTSDRALAMVLAIPPKNSGSFQVSGDSDDAAVVLRKRVVFAAGSAGARDVTVSAAVPYAIRIVDVDLYTTTAGGVLSTGTLRSATGGGGSALSSALDTATVGRARNADTDERDVALGTPLILRLTDGTAAGKIMVRYVRQ